MSGWGGTGGGSAGSAPDKRRPDAHLPAQTSALKGDELYPGFVVHDERVSGSITVGQSRLPVWAIPASFALTENWDYAPGLYGVTDEDVAEFVHDLLDNARRDIGRALLVIADTGRREYRSGKPYGGKRNAQRLAKALRAAADYVEFDYERNTTASRSDASNSAKNPSPGGRGVS